MNKIFFTKRQAASFLSKLLLKIIKQFYGNVKYSCSNIKQEEAFLYFKQDKNVQ